MIFLFLLTKYFFAKSAQDFIYILFAIVYIIYSVIKAGKKVAKNRPTVDTKPKPVSPPASPQPQPNEDFKKVMEEMFGKLPEPKVSQPQVQKPKPQISSAKPQPVKIKTHVPVKESRVLGTKTVKPLSPQPHPSLIKTETTEVEEEVVDFDFRKAIIFSEILKRPNW